jgi:hypothetical protein
MAPDDPRHGTTRGYHAGCKEPCCRRAMARYEKAGRLARLNGGLAVPAIGAQRRLQALMRLGWSSHRIAAEAGLSHRNHVWRIVNGQNGKPTKWLQRSTHEWVCRVYDKLSMRVPEGAYAERTRRHAERQGWAPPLAWDEGSIDDPAATPCGDLSAGDVDPVVVDRILYGDFNTPATAAERAEVCARWAADGRSLYELRKVTGWKVERYFKKEDAA